MAGGAGGITGGLYTAASALSTMQQLMNLNAGNLANVTNPDYSKRVGHAVTLATGGVSQGITLSEISRQFDPVLQSNMLNSISDLEYKTTISEGLQQVQLIFGGASDQSSLSHRINKFFSELSLLDQAPSSPQALTNVMTSATKLVEDLQNFSNRLQTLRKEADTGINDSVERTNYLIDKFYEVNGELSTITGTGGSTAAHEQIRDGLLKEIAEHLPVQQFIKSTGGSYLQTPSGIPLVNTLARHLSFNASAAVGPATTYPALSGVFDADGDDVTAKIKSGKIKGNIDLRDNILPQIQDEIDEFTMRLRDSINEIHNRGTSYKAQTTLSGQRVIPGANTAARDLVAFSGTGTLRVAVMNNANNVVESYTDLDLSTVATMGALRTALNTAIQGTTATFNVQYTASGQLEIISGDPNKGVALTSVGATTAIETTTGANFSHYFGLNDFFLTTGNQVGASRLGISGTIKINPTLVADAGKIARAKLESGAITVGTTEGITAGDGRTINDLLKLKDQNISFTLAGGITATTTTLTGYATAIVGFEATRAANSDAEQDYADVSFNTAEGNFLNYSGVNLEKEMIALQQNLMAHNASSAVFAILKEASRDVLRLAS